MYTYTNFYQQSLLWESDIPAQKYHTRAFLKEKMLSLLALLYGKQFISLNMYITYYILYIMYIIV